MAMDADAVIYPAVVREIAGSISRIYRLFSTENFFRYILHAENLFYFFPIAVSSLKDLILFSNDNIGTLHKTDMSLMRAIGDGFISMPLLSFCALSDSSLFSDDLFLCRGETG